MPERYLTLDDIQDVDSPDKIAVIFGKLGYNANAQPLAVEELELSPQSAAAVRDAYLIADEGGGELQVLLFELQADGFRSPKAAKMRMAAIAQSLCKRLSRFLLLATYNYSRLLLVNPQRSFDDWNLKTSVKYWLINLINPTTCDRYLLKALTAVTSDPQELYNIQCEAFDFFTKPLPRRKPVYTKNSIYLYLQEIGRIRLLRANEEIELARKIADLLELESVREQLSWKLGRVPDDSEWADAVNMPLPAFRHRLFVGRQAKDKMVQSNLRLVVSIATRYQNRGLDFQDLIQEGNLGLIRAVEKFNPCMGYTFCTYAVWWIRQAITLAVKEQSRTIRLPVHIYERISKIKKTVKLLSQEMGRDPTEEEIVTCMEMTIEKFRFILKSAQPIVSLETLPKIIPQSRWIGKEEEYTQGDLIEFDEETPEDNVCENILREDIEIVLAILSTREQDVLRLRYGLYDGQMKTLEEIGQIFNVTRERIRQIEAKAMRKLRRHYGQSIPKDYLIPSCNQIRNVVQASRPLRQDACTEVLRFRRQLGIIQTETPPIAQEVSYLGTALNKADRREINLRATENLEEIVTKNSSSINSFILTLDSSTRSSINKCIWRGKVEISNSLDGIYNLLIVCPSDGVQSVLRKQFVQLAEKFQQFVGDFGVIGLCTDRDPIELYDWQASISQWIVENVFTINLESYTQMRHKNHRWFVVLPN